MVETKGRLAVESSGEWLVTSRWPDSDMEPDGVEEYLGAIHQGEECIYYKARMYMTNGNIKYWYWVLDENGWELANNGPAFSPAVDQMLQAGLDAMIK